MIYFALSLLSGIAAFKLFPFFPISIIAVFIVTAVSLLLRRSAGKKKIIVYILTVLFGFFYSLLRQDTLPEITLPDNDVVIEGTIADVPELSAEKLRIMIKDVIIDKEKVRGRVRLVVLPEKSGDKFNEAPPEPGNRIWAIAKLREPTTLHNPGVYTQNLKRSGIVAVGYIKQMEIIDRGDGFLTRIFKVRQELAKVIDKGLSRENASFHNAIITGLTGGISQDMRDAFSTTGLAHILSISGTHFGLLAFMFFTLIRSIIKYLPAQYLTRMTLYITPTQTAVILTLPILFIYAVISGLSTPTIRSFIMVFIYMLALLLGRKDQWLNSLSIAAALILLWKPEALVELSFILSFTAVLSIGFVLEQRAKSTDERPKIPALPVSPLSKDGVKGVINAAYEKMSTGILITLAAVLGTAPFATLYFKQVPLISPLTNLLITPLICFVILPFGLISSFSALIFNMSSMPLNGLIDTVTYFTLKLINSFSDVPYASVHIHNPSFAIIAGYFLSLIFLVKSTFKWRFIPLFFVIGIYLACPYLSANKLAVTFLDVGQGDASVVELPDGKIMLIDGSTLDPDMGRMVIAPYLWSKGIGEVDYMVMSHSHPDHYGGLIYVVDNMDVGELWFNGMVSDGAEALFKRATIRNVPHKALNRGDMLEGNGYRINVLHPHDEFSADSPRGDFSIQNSASLVLKIDAGDASILLTGDIEAEAEENLLHLGDWLKSDIIKAPHHGGMTSNSEGFITAVSPRIAVISAGRGNSFGHPHKKTLERYEKAGAKVFRTDMDGAVTITRHVNSYEIETYEDSAFKTVGAWRDESRNLRLLF